MFILHHTNNSTIISSGVTNIMTLNYMKYQSLGQICIMAHISIGVHKISEQCHPSSPRYRSRSIHSQGLLLQINGSTGKKKKITEMNDVKSELPTSLIIAGMNSFLNVLFALLLSICFTCQLLRGVVESNQHINRTNHLLLFSEVQTMSDSWLNKINNLEENEKMLVLNI